MSRRTSRPPPTPHPPPLRQAALCIIPDSKAAAGEEGRGKGRFEAPGRAGARCLFLGELLDFVNDGLVPDYASVFVQRGYRGERVCFALYLGMET